MQAIFSTSFCIPQVVFADGQSASTIILTVKDDDIPELEESSHITLAEVVKSGSDRTDRGAVIGLWYLMCTISWSE